VVSAAGYSLGASIGIIVVASPQLENGHTRIANELLEAILRTPLSSREQKCLLAVARETYGWSCKAKTVTAYRVATLTGMQRTQAARALRILKQRNILVNGSEGLGLQKNYDEWLRPVRFKTDRVQTGTGPNQIGSESNPKTGSKLDGAIGSRSDPHKERKQENKTTDAGTSAHQTVLREFDRLFTGRFSARPDIVGGRDGAIVRDLLRTHPVDQVLELLGGFFRVGTRFSRERGAYSLAAFKGQYNDLLVMKFRGEL